MQVVWAARDSVVTQGADFPPQLCSPLGTSARHCFAAENLGPSANFPRTEGPDRLGPPLPKILSVSESRLPGPPSHLLSGDGMTQHLALSCLCRVGLSSPGSQGWRRWPWRAESGGQGQGPSPEVLRTLVVASHVRLTAVAPGFRRLRNY